MKKHFLVFLVISLFLVSGQQGCEKPGEVTGVSDVVSIDFTDQRPPEEVLDNNLDPFYITLKLINNGDYTIPANKIIASITSLSKEAFKLGNLHAVFKPSLISKEDELIAEEEFDLSRASYQYDLTKDFVTNIDINICYPYQSKAIFNVCLKKKAIEREGANEICSVNNDLIVENQLAPIQIIDIKQKAVGLNKIRLTFTVKNIGSGEIYAPTAFKNKCLENRLEEDMVKLMIFSKSIPVKCTALENNKGNVRLINGVKIISCDLNTKNVPQTTAFEEQFEVKAEYYNKYKLSKSLTVVNALE